MVRKCATKTPATAGTSDVTANPYLVAPEEKFTRKNLLRHLSQAIKRQRLSQSSAAARMGIDRAKVSALMNGRVDNVPSDQLMRLLIRLGQDIEITVRPKPRDRARGRLRLLGEARA